MNSHIYARHRGEVLDEFRRNPAVQRAVAVHNLLMFARDRVPKALPASPPEIEHALNYLLGEENRLAHDMAELGITAERVQTGDVPNYIVDRLRALMRSERDLTGFPVWDVPVFEKQCEHADTVIGYAFVERCPICGQRNPFRIDMPIDDEAVATIL